MKKWRLKDAERAVRVAVPRLPDALFMLSQYKTGGLKAPGYSCSRLPDGFVQHFRLTFIAHYHVILNLFQDLSAEKNKKGSR